MSVFHSQAAIKTHTLQESTVASIGDDLAPHGIALERWYMAEDEQRATSARERHVHAADIAEEADTGGTNAREDDNILFLALEAVHGLEAGSVSLCATGARATHSILCKISGPNASENALWSTVICSLYIEMTPTSTSLGPKRSRRLL